MDRIGIEFISVLGMPPVEFVHLAADLDCAHIGMALAPMFATPLDYSAWSLRNNPQLRRDVAAAMRERGVSISIGEGFLIRPDVDAQTYAGDLDALCELGARRINLCSIEPDLTRGFDQCGALVQMADALGLESTLEFGPLFAIADLPAALAALRHVGRPNFRLLFDTLHVARLGLDPRDIAALDPNLIGYAQLCDAPRAFTRESYMYEARFERSAPGTGELPIAEIVAALPRDIVLGLEVPGLKETQAGVEPRRRLGRCVEATRRLVAELKS